MIKFLSLLLTVFFLAGCFENSTPSPINKPLTERKGEWESSGVDDPPAEAPVLAPEVVVGQFSLPRFYPGEICFKDEETAKKLSPFLNVYDFLDLFNPYLKLHIPLDENSELKNLSQSLEESVQEVLLKIQTIDTVISESIKKSLKKISLTSETLVSENSDSLLFPLSSSKCLKIRFTKRENVSMLKGDLNFESKISLYVFNRLTKEQRLKLVLEEAMAISVLNDDLFSGTTEISIFINDMLQGSF